MENSEKFTGVLQILKLIAVSCTKVGRNTNVYLKPLAATKMNQLKKNIINRMRKANATNYKQQKYQLQHNLTTAKNTTQKNQIS